MIKTKHVKSAKQIGDGSYELISFMQLPRNASKERQIEAIHSDQRWQQDRCDEVAGQIDILIREIERVDE